MTEATDSMFRKITATETSLDHSYQDIPVTSQRWKSNIMAVNLKYIAVVTKTDEDKTFMIIKHGQSACTDSDASLVAGHKGAVKDLQWCPHNARFIASASANYTVKIWYIKADRFANGRLTKCYKELAGHSKGVNLVNWHPSVNMLLLTAGEDKLVLLWNVEASKIVIAINLPSVVTSCSWNWDGSTVACSCKDNMIRILDPRAADEKVLKEKKLQRVLHRVLYLKSGNILSTGIGELSNLVVWNSNLEKLKQLNFRSPDATVRFPFYDPGTSLVYIIKEGGFQISCYQECKEAPFIKYLSSFDSQVSQLGAAMLPKLGLDVANNEIARFYKLLPNGICQAVSFKMPRSDEFQADLHPSTLSTQPALSISHWLEGISKAPVTVRVDPKAEPVACKAAADD